MPRARLITLLSKRLVSLSKIINDHIKPGIKTKIIRPKINLSVSTIKSILILFFLFSVSYNTEVVHK